jgi:hypothetical protein
VDQQARGAGTNVITQVDGTPESRWFAIRTEGRDQVPSRVICFGGVVGRVPSLKGAEIRSRSRRTLVFVYQPAQPVAPSRSHRLRATPTFDRRPTIWRREFQAPMRSMDVVMIDENRQSARDAGRSQSATSPSTRTESMTCRACCVTDAATGDFDEERHVQALQPAVSTVKKSTAITLAAWARRNSRPVGPRRFPAGPSCSSRRIRLTVVADTTTPRPFSSPTMR